MSTLSEFLYSRGKITDKFPIAHLCARFCVPGPGFPVCLSRDRPPSFWPLRIWVHERRWNRPARFAGANKCRWSIMRGLNDGRNSFFDAGIYKNFHLRHTSAFHWQANVIFTCELTQRYEHKEDQNQAIMKCYIHYWYETMQKYT